MNTVGKGLLAGSAVLLIGTAGAGIATGLVEPEVQVKEIVSPGPTVTEIRTHKVPVPGPTVTKKVVVTKTARSVVTKEVTRSNDRKKKTKKFQAPRVSSGSARDIARSIFGSQFSCANALINQESSWNVQATNPSSGAYGLPQSLPGSKMASAGSDWRTNPATQLRWMKAYLDGRYGGACAGWEFWRSHGWY